MDSRLFKASYSGNVGALLELLKENPIILHNVTLNSSDNPLHIASLFDHVEFARVVMSHNPELAHELNGQGFGSIHLASSKGHLQIVKDLLEFDPKLGVLKDQEGRIPIHFSAVKGKVEVLKELFLSCPQSAQERTRKGESILHLATEGKQCKMVKFLLTKTNVEVNATNLEGHTALDIAMIHSIDKDIEELLRGAGGQQSTRHYSPREEQKDEDVTSAQDVQLIIDHDTEKQQKQQLRQRITKTLSNITSKSAFQRRQQRLQLIESLKSGIMILAIMFATLSFEVAMNPPGGLWQDWDENTSPNITAAAIAGITDSSNSIPLKLLFQFRSQWKSSHIPNVTLANAHRPGKAINREYAKKDFISFMGYNATCFCLSLMLIGMIAVTGTFDFEKYDAVPILTTTFTLILYATQLFRTGMTMVTDKNVSQWAMYGATFNMTFVIVSVLVYNCCKQLIG